MEWLPEARGPYRFAQSLALRAWQEASPDSSSGKRAGGFREVRRTAAKRLRHARSRRAGKNAVAVNLDLAAQVSDRLVHLRFEVAEIAGKCTDKDAARELRGALDAAAKDMPLVTRGG